MFCFAKQAKTRGLGFRVAVQFAAVFSVFFFAAKNSPLNVILPCERGSHRHTVVVTRPRLSLALWLLSSSPCRPVVVGVKTRKNLPCSRRYRIEHRPHAPCAAFFNASDMALENAFARSARSCHTRMCRFTKQSYCRGVSRATGARSRSWRFAQAFRARHFWLARRGAPRARARPALAGRPR